MNISGTIWCPATDLAACFPNSDHRQPTIIPLATGLASCLLTSDHHRPGHMAHVYMPDPIYQVVQGQCGFLL